MSIHATRLARLLCVALALLGLAVLMVDQADARGGRGGGGFGSRGTRTYEAPPTTRTAPTPAKPIERSITQPGQPAAGTAATRPTAAQASRFGSTMRNVLLGGLIGGLLASMLGAGTLAAVLGFLLQALLIGGLVYLAIALFRGRRGAAPAPALATANAGPSPPRPDTAAYRSATGLPGGGASPVLNLVQADFDAFERLLGEVQAAYGRADIDALGDRVTPEMLSYFAQELDEDRKKGRRNEVGAPKLLQGDLSEAWREASGEWATVAMRYQLTDAVVEVATGKVVSGSRSEPEEVTELWTFRRPHGAGPDMWELSAIQQV
jgi:predicted lipid-binding transport protein (Tim44 family)